MAAARKYAGLDDIDDAADIYETPELTDGSTVQTSTARSPSPDAEESDAGASSGIIRGRLDPDQARNRFLPSRVDASEADFSDRVTAKKQSYRVSNRRRRDGSVIEDGEHEDEEFSDEDTDEGLERKLARLTREIEEVKSGFAQRQTEQQDGDIKQGDKSDKGTANAIDALSKALDALRSSQRDAVSAHSRLAKQLSESAATAPNQHIAPPSVAPATQSPPVDAETLARIASFDARLSDLERTLGLSNLDISSKTTSSIIPILPTLSLLDKQVHLLTSADTLPYLDGLTEKLSSVPSTKPSPADTEDSALSSEDKAKLRSLYALLPTLTTMAPTVPALLVRLRSLRQIHASAAGAGQLLEELERRQDETDKEIAAWKAGLERVETAVRETQGGMKANSDVVEGWVKELEAKFRDAGME
ncbi:hypothetical protein MBLNU457_7589t1 [Dothideomycetes sp. NU457]